MTTADRLRTIAEGPALDLPPVAWEPPNHIGLSARTPVAWEPPNHIGLSARTPVAWEPPNHIDILARTPFAKWGDPAFGGPSVHLTPTGTTYYPHPLIYIGDETMGVDQAEVAARHLLAAVAMAREVTR